MTDPITRILVPVDFSAHSNRAVQYAATLAGQVGASVELMHVVEAFTAGAFASEAYVPSLPDMIETLMNEATRRLTDVRNEAFPHGSDVETSVFVGHPALAILERAATGHFDLIIMGTHGRTGLSHIFMGSVAERVVRSAPCAVLTVRSPATGSARTRAAGMVAA